MAFRLAANTLVRILQMAMFGLLVFRAPYLPWVMLGFSVLIGNTITMDLIGIAVGHVYYFLEFVYPVMAELRGWQLKRLMEPPTIIRWVCDSLLQENDGHRIHFHQD
jgi:Derlin-2/3